MVVASLASKHLGYNIIKKVFVFQIEKHIFQIFGIEFLGQYVIYWETLPAVFGKKLLNEELKNMKVQNLKISCTREKVY